MTLRTPQLSIRLATREDARAFCDLSNSIYARKVSPEYYCWQFFETPHPAYVQTMWLGDRLVGTFGVHIVGDARMRRAMCLDIMVAPDMQGKALVADLGRSADQEARRLGATLIGVVANDRARRALQKHLGWHLVEELAEWNAQTAYRVSDISVAVNRSRSTPHGEERAVFYPRSEEYLIWRTSTPRYQHVWLSLLSQDRQVGSAVVKVFEDPTTHERFGDLLEIAVAETDDMRRSVLAVLAWFSARGVPTCTAYPLHDTREVLLSCGFAATDRTRFFCGLESGLRELEVGMLDVDVF